MRRSRRQTPQPRGKGAAPAGCVQRNIHLSELRQIVRFYRILRHRCIAAFGGVTAPITPICVPQAKQTWRSQCLARSSPLPWRQSCSRPLPWRPPRLRPPRASASAQARTRALPSRASLQLRTRSSTGTTIWRPPIRVGAAETRSARERGCAVTSQRNFPSNGGALRGRCLFREQLLAPRTGNAEAKRGPTAFTNVQQPRCPGCKTAFAARTYPSPVTLAL